MSQWGPKPKHAPCSCGCGEMADECMGGGRNPLDAFTITEPIGSQPRTPHDAKHRDDSHEALALCQKRERSTLTIRLYDGLYDPRHSAAHRTGAGA